MANQALHKHDFKRVAIKQELDNDLYIGSVPPVILLWKCSCGYKYAYDLMDRNEFYERYQKTNMQGV